MNQLTFWGLWIGNQESKNCEEGQKYTISEEIKEVADLSKHIPLVVEEASH